MVRLILFILVVVIFAILFSSKSKTLPKKSKIALVVTLGALLVFGYLHEIKSTQQDKKDQELLSAFKQGKVLLCNGISVSKETFMYVSGTLSFIPQATNVQNKGAVLQLHTCSIN